MSRPMPQFPRGRRRPTPSPEVLVLAVPPVSPQRQLHTMRAFVKPHDWTREAIRHRLETDADGSYEQPWEPEYARQATDAAARAAERLGVSYEAVPGATHLSFRFAPGTAAELARAVGVVCSRRLPRTWWTVDRLALLDGRFWRRQRGRMLHLKPAPDVHLPREVRAAIRDLL